jgi:TRAP-type C4-dicarboxylate transport system substrate-binding protein
MFFSRRTLIASAALAVATFSAAAASAAELIYGSWAPAPAYANRVVLPKVFKDIETATKGEIKWKIVAGGQIAGPKESYQAVQDGLLQAAFGVSIYVPNLVPSTNAIYSTLVFEGGSIEATAAQMETLLLNCPSCIEEFKKINMVVMGGWSSAQYHLSCREPITRAEDLKGKRIRGTGGPAQLWELAGAVPISATLPEALTLLQRGGMDCMHNTYSWLKTFGYGDFAKNVIDFPLSASGPALGLMINRDTWKKFTPEQRTLHMKGAAYASAAEAIGDFTIDNENTLKEVMKTKDVKLIKAEPAGFRDLVAKFEKVQRDTVVAEAKKFGVANPESFLDAYKKNLEKWKGLTRGLNNDIDKYADLLWKEVYSKVDVNKL